MFRMTFLAALSVPAPSAAFTATGGRATGRPLPHTESGVPSPPSALRRGRALGAFDAVAGAFGAAQREAARRVGLLPTEPSGDGVPLDVLVVGAGAAGVGTALMLTETFGLDKSKVLLVERGDVGESFQRWPAEMRFISPSFNQQGWTESFDLNAVAHGTSPAFSLHTEHPSGREYAEYLAALAGTAELQVRRRTEVVSVAPVGGDGPPRFDVSVRAADADDGTETLSARYLVWAAGEFQYPRAASDAEGGFPGAELCTHNSRVGSWAEVPGDDFLVIGGYESGVDAAVNLARAGKRCRVLASTPCWDVKTDDPSYELAPYTADRLRQVTGPGFSPRPDLLAPLRVKKVEAAPEGGFHVTATWSKYEPTYHAPLRKFVPDPATEPGEEGSTQVLHTPVPPILCTGFEGSVRCAAGHLFDFAPGGGAGGCLVTAPLLTDSDESTAVPGIFLVGPQVKQEGLSFCFVYKFRQRFAIVANAICRGLGRDTRAAVEDCKEVNMYLEKYDCCEDTCTDVC